MTTFIWYPDASIAVETEPEVNVSKFGDGYESRRPSGINTMAEKWNLAFTGTRAEIDPIAAFLRARGGHEAFDWITPDQRPGRFIARKWNKTRERGVKVTLTCTLQEVFGS